MSILKQTYDLLKQNGYDVYFPAQHKGECEKEYIVIKLEDAPEELNVSSERPIYTIMCYVPERNYSLLETMIYDVKQVLKRMFPTLMYAGNQTPSFYDEKTKSHMISFQYQGIRKINNW